MKSKIPVYIECKDYIMDFDNLPTDRPIVLGFTTEWEVYCLKNAAELFKGHDRILYLKDSCRILDPEAFWKVIDSTPIDENTFLFSDKNCYLGVFKTDDIVSQLAKIKPYTKWDSIKTEWRMGTLFPGGSIWQMGEPYPNHSDLEGRKRLEFHNGTIEVVYGNDIIEKWKSSSGCGCKVNRLKVCKHMLSGVREEDVNV